MQFWLYFHPWDVVNDNLASVPDYVRARLLVEWLTLGCHAGVWGSNLALDKFMFQRNKMFPTFQLVKIQYCRESLRDRYVVCSASNTESSVINCQKGCMIKLHVCARM